MSVRVALQMDPIDQVDIRADTTYALALEAQARGHQLWVYGPVALSWAEGRVQARARSVSLTNTPEEPVRFCVPEVLDLADDVDVILMRQDPPFDMSYITAAHLLEFVHPKTLVVNDPAWVRSSPEKILPLLFPDLMPSTLVSRDPEALTAFRALHGDIVVKPLYGNGGAGVFALKSGDGNFNALLEMFFAQSREPVMAQAFLPAVSQGDKRVILIDGEPVGAINRVPAKGEARSNMHAGGRAEAAELSDADRAICARIGPVLRERGLTLVGIDVIGDRMTEIKVTSPTGVQELKRFSGIDAAALFWDAVERRRQDTV
ncbi:MAG: glutathione synthase [Maricaulaceae bacterium]